MIKESNKEYCYYFLFFLLEIDIFRPERHYCNIFKFSGFGEITDHMCTAKSFEIIIKNVIQPNLSHKHKTYMQTIDNETEKSC